LLISSSVFCFGCSTDSNKSQNNEKQNEKPNVLVIVLDDVGFNRLGSISGHNLTPNIDKLLEDGVLYENAYTSSAVCTPSRYSLLTGNFAGRCTHPRFNGHIPKTEPYRINWNTFIDQSDLTMHEVMKDNGYYTGFIGKWHLGHLDDLRSCTPKIDVNSIAEEVNDQIKEYNDTAIKIVKELTGAHFVASIIFENNENNPIEVLKNHHTEFITKGFYDFIDSVPKDKPFFAYFATTLTHGPSAIKSLRANSKYTPAGIIDSLEMYQSSRKMIIELSTKKVKNWDDGAIGAVWLDDQIGALVKKLKDNGEYDNTIIFFISDNNNEPGKATCYEAGIHVPLFIKWNKSKNAGTKSQIPLQLVDVFPTILDACKISYDEKQFDGISLFNTKEQRNDLYFEMGLTRAIKWKNYKYLAFRLPDSEIIAMKEGKATEAPNQMGITWAQQTYIAMNFYPSYWDQDQLYDLEKDPYELNNLANDSTYSEVLTEMKIRLNKYLSTFDNPFSLDFQEYMASDDFMKLTKETEKGIQENLQSLWLTEFVWPPKNQK
jgi:arylsulfatase A